MSTIIMHDYLAPNKVELMLIECMLHNIEVGKKNDDNNEYIVPVLAGPPGHGKTTTGKRAAVLVKKKLKEDFPTVELTLTDRDPVEMGGMLYPYPDEKICRRLNLEDVNPTKHGNRMYDEIGQGAMANKNVFARHANERIIGDVRLNKGWTIMGCTNETKDKSGTTLWPMHLKSRVVFIYMRIPKDDGVEYAIQRGYDPSLISFLHINWDEPELNGFDPTQDSNPDPRAWERVNQIMGLNLTDALKYAMVSGKVGKASATKFWAYRKIYNEMPNWENVVKDVNSVPTFDDNPEIKYALYCALASNANRQNIGGIMRYMMRSVHQEFTTFAMRIMAKRDPSLLTTKSVLDWKIKHAPDMLDI